MAETLERAFAVGEPYPLPDRLVVADFGVALVPAGLAAAALMAGLDGRFAAVGFAVRRPAGITRIAPGIGARTVRRPSFQRTA